MKITYLPTFAILFGTTLLSGLPLWAGDAKSDCANEDHFPIISTSELIQVLADEPKPFVVDVNSKETFDDNHVPGALHYGSRSAAFAKLLPENKGALIISYCGGPKCNAWKKAATEACNLGYTNIRHFKEGIKGWNSHPKVSAQTSGKAFRPQ